MQQSSAKKGKGKKEKKEFAKNLGGPSTLTSKKHARKGSSEDVKRSQEIPQSVVASQDEETKETSKMNYRFLSFI